MTEWSFCKRGSVRHDDESWVRIIVHIRNNITGKVVVRHTDTIWYPEIDDMLFIWKEGNFSCDCNRRIFFEGRNEKDYDDQFCGYSIYSVNIMNPENGQWLYREFDVEDIAPSKKKETVASEKVPGSTIIGRKEVRITPESTIGKRKGGRKKKRGRPPKKKITPPVEQPDPKDEEMNKDEQPESEKESDYQVPTVSEETVEDAVARHNEGSRQADD